MKVLFRVCDAGIISEFDTELLVYYMEGSVDAWILPCPP